MTTIRGKNNRIAVGEATWIAASNGTLDGEDGHVLADDVSGAGALSVRVFFDAAANTFDLYTTQLGTLYYLWDATERDADYLEANADEVAVTEASTLGIDLSSASPGAGSLQVVLVTAQGHQSNVARVADTLAATLSSPSGATDGLSVTVATNHTGSGSGTVYYRVRNSGDSAANATAIKAGGGVDAGDTTDPGSSPVTFVTALGAGSYAVDFVQDNGEDSAVVSSATFVVSGANDILPNVPDSIWIAAYDATDASTVTTATGVSQWDDKVAALDLTQSTGGNQPPYNTAGGFNFIEWGKDNTEKYLKRISDYDWSTTPKSVVMRIRLHDQGTSAANQSMITAMGTTTNDWAGAFQPATSTDHEGSSFTDNSVSVYGNGSIVGNPGVTQRQTVYNFGFVTNDNTWITVEVAGIQSASLDEFHPLRWASTTGWVVPCDVAFIGICETSDAATYRADIHSDLVDLTT